MTTINMLRGGKTNGRDGRQYTQNMYPRPDYKVSEMGKLDGWENRIDSVHYTALFDLALCWNSGAVERAKDADTTTEECSLEVGDVIPLLWVPSRSTVEGITLNVVSGVEGVVLGVKSRHFIEDDFTLTPATGPTEVVEFTGVNCTPISNPAIPEGGVDQDYLDSFKCGNRLSFDDFGCSSVNQGPFVEMRLANPVLVGAGPMLPDTQTVHAAWMGGYMLELVVEGLPVEGLDCSTSCLRVDLGARVRVPRAGN